MYGLLVFLDNSNTVLLQRRRTPAFKNGFLDALMFPKMDSLEAFAERIVGKSKVFPLASLHTIPQGQLELLAVRGRLVDDAPLHEVTLASTFLLPADVVHYLRWAVPLALDNLLISRNVEVKVDYREEDL